LLYFLAYPGVGLWQLAFVAFAPLLVALEGSSAKQGALLGWNAGFVMTLCGFHWMQHMLATFSGFSAAACFLLHALLAAYQGGRIALFGWLYVRGRRNGIGSAWMLPLAFIASEHLYPLLFTWYFGAALHQQPSLSQLAELGNPIAVGLVLLPTNWLALELCLAFRQRRRPRVARLACAALLPLLAFGFGHWRIGQLESLIRQAPHITVGAVQANMGLIAKRSERDEGLLRHLRLSRELTAKMPLDLLVWSETSLAAAVDESKAANYYQARVTELVGVPTVFGAVLARPVNDARRYALFNAALLSDQQGRVVGRYNKHHLLAFGEYLPFGDWFPKLYEWSPNTGRFAPGSSYAPLTLDGYKLSINICYEDIIPSFVNALVRSEPADLLVNLTNDAWFGDSSEPWIHLALAQFRAIEHRRAFVRSTNSGVSAIIDPLGRVIAHTPTFQQATIAAAVPLLKTSKTLYEQIGDIPWWLASLAAILLAFWPTPRRPQRPRPASTERPEAVQPETPRRDAPLETLQS
jgi:apolipoprotein N-acyltransferase